MTPHLIRIDFTREGIEISTTYAHDDGIPSPGTKTRTTTAVRIARKGLEHALKGLGTGEAIWGGFATNTKVSTDTIIVDRKEDAA